MLPQAGLNSARSVKSACDILYFIWQSVFFLVFSQALLWYHIEKSSPRSLLISAVTTLMR